MEAALILVAILVVAALALALGGMFNDGGRDRRTVVIERPIRRRRVRRVVEDPVDEVVEVVEDRH